MEFVFMFNYILYGAHELFIVKPLILERRHCARFHLRGNVKTLPSRFLTHCLCLRVCLLQLTIFLFRVLRVAIGYTKLKTEINRI